MEHPRHSCKLRVLPALLCKYGSGGSYAVKMYDGFRSFVRVFYILLQNVVYFLLQTLMRLIIIGPFFNPNYASTDTGVSLPN